MADRYRTATGLWSDVTKWDGGVALPAVGDDVFANNYVCTVDQSVTVANFRNTASAPAVAGGSFALNDGVTATGNVVGGAALLMTYAGSTPAQATIEGNITGGTAAFAAVTLTGSGTLNVNGNVVGGSVSGATGITNSSGGELVITGDVTGAAAIAITSLISGGRLTVNGNVQGGTVNAMYGISFASAVGGALTVNGDVIGSLTPVVTTATGINIGAGDYAITINGTVRGAYSGGISAGTANAYLGTMTINGGPAGAVLGGTDPGHVTIACTVSHVGAVLNVTGNVTGGVGAGTIGLSTSAGVFNLTGDMTGGTGSAATALASSSVLATLTGNVLSPVGALGAGFLYTGPAGAVATLTGNVESNNGPCTCSNGGVGTLNVIGNVRGGTLASAHGVNNLLAGTVNITGDVTGGGIVSAPGANNVQLGTLNVFGTAIGSPTNSGAPGVINASLGTCYVQVARSNNYPNDGITLGAVGVSNTNVLGSTTIGALEDGTGGWCATATGRFFIRASAVNYTKMRESNEGSILTMGELTIDYPDTADVRGGVVFDFGNLEGTCAVPPAGSVALGVPVDAAVGTAALTPEALLGAALVARLTQCATVQTTGDQLAALGA